MLEIGSWSRTWDGGMMKRNCCCLLASGLVRVEEAREWRYRKTGQYDPADEA